MNNGYHSNAWIRSRWFATLVLRATDLTDDADLALRSAELAIASCPFPEEEETVDLAMDALLGVDLAWTGPHQGARGGYYWESNVTREKRYQREKPSEREEGQQPQGQQRRPAQQKPQRPQLPPRTPQFKQVRGEEGELKGYALRDLAGKEYGLYKTEQEAQQAAQQLGDTGENEYSPVEVWGAPDQPKQQQPSDDRQEEEKYRLEAAHKREKLEIKRRRRAEDRQAEKQHGDDDPYWQALEDRRQEEDDKVFERWRLEEEALEEKFVKEDQEAAQGAQPTPQQQTPTPQTPQQVPSPQAPPRPPKPIKPDNLVNALPHLPGGKDNFVSLVAIRDLLARAGLDRDTQDSLIQKARRDGVLTLSAAEGRHGISDADRNAGIPEEGSLLLYASALKPQQQRGLSISLAHDIFDPRAQGILNKAMEAAKKISAQARRELKALLELPSIQEISQKLEGWAVKYRQPIAAVLSRTQFAALLEGMKQVAQSVPPSLRGVSSVGLPASLPPEDAEALLELIKELPEERREEEIYELPADQQEYVRTALAAEEAELPLEESTAEAVHLPEGEEGEEELHLHTIDEAARLLSEKRLVTREEFDALSDAARQKAFTVAGVTSDETLEKIRDALSENLREGVDLKDFRDKVLEAVDEGTFLSDAHMEVVFRTAIQSQLSDGQLEVLNDPFVKSGFPYASYNAIHDDRVREEHKELEGKGINGTNVFRVDDPVFKTFRPPWSYNCVLPGNIVSGRIVGALKGFYSGDAVEITTANGARTTLTINHPVLTEHGFISAGQLKEGNNLLCHLGKIKGHRGFDDVQDCPALIEDVFKSLSSSLERESLLAFDFNGDEAFMVGEIDMVLPYLYRRERITSKTKRKDQVSFISPDDSSMRMTELCDLLLLGHSRPLDSLSIALTANRHATSQQSFSDSATGNSQRTSNRVFGLSRGIPLDNIHIVRAESVPDFYRFGLASELDTVFSQPSSNGCSFNPNIVSELLEGFPSNVSLSKVTNVRHFQYSGPVYDLETTPGYFTTTLGGQASIIIRNCRCNWTAMTVESAAEAGVKEAKTWLKSGIEPDKPAFVDMPDFEPPASFRRDQALSIQLSMTSLEKWHEGRQARSARPAETPAAASPAAKAGEDQAAT